VKVEGYELIMHVCVDHPERRDASFHPVPAGTVARQRIWSKKLKPLVMEFNDVLAGLADFGSEYVAVARINRIHENGGWSRVRLERFRDGRGSPWEVRT